MDIQKTLSQPRLKIAPLPVTEELLQEIVQCIVKAFAPEKIILFGSYAYGNPTSDSNVDLLSPHSGRVGPAFGNWRFFLQRDY